MHDQKWGGVTSLVVLPVVGAVREIWLSEANKKATTIVVAFAIN